MTRHCGCHGSAPGNVISRLLCPRRLDPETSYTAFLVPAFEIGGRPDWARTFPASPTADAGVDQRHTCSAVDCPFTISSNSTPAMQGDFESLVRRLTPRVLAGEVGERPMDVTKPAPHIRSAGPPLGLEGALHSVLTQPTPVERSGQNDFPDGCPSIHQSSQRVQRRSANPNPDDPVIAPPIYGRWHAAVQSVDRTAAGMGERSES